ncbi:biotin--[acetyl-CoA-carboxylase] ligase [Azoarcus olearius]|uniref:biotin--[acetyl-CoA-carboxylase] ligase n=1 Tax=Azoarcus sp. (strain BH72) TaxID=418699 RepID=UPI000806B1A8|nr:biotin--[acetyl-CoA-carboxylase] ligase [Azoarcus olearius]
MSALLSSPAAINAALGDLVDRFAVRCIARCGSTNSELLNATPPDDDRVHVLVADEQTGGRGRRGRQWLSWPEGSLTFSSLWRFAPGAPVPAGLSLVAGLALARALEKLGLEGIQLKWPNDLLVHGCKLAGILVELLPGRGRTPAAVIGIGLNLRLPPEADIPDQGGVTDLHTEIPALPPREQLLAAILRELHAALDLYAMAGFGALRGAWQQRNAFADLPVRIFGEGSEIVGICTGVDEDGALLVRTDAGVVRVLSGEVSLRAAP